MSSIYAMSTFQFQASIGWDTAGAKLTGKRESDGEIKNMTKESEYPVQQGGSRGAACPLMKNEKECATGLYYDIAALNFTQPTDEPRPINITMSDYMLQVSVICSNV